MNILIKEDRSYMSEVDFLAIEKGVANLGIHSLKFHDYISDEQKQENLKEHDRLTEEQWAERCEQHQKSVGIKMEKLMDEINDNFTMYQYKNESVSYKDNWDLFFYSNRGWNNKDYMTYATLNPNDKRSVEQQITDINNVIEFLNTVECEGLKVNIQYTAIYDEPKVKQIITDYCNTVKDTFIEMNGQTGKIKEIGIGHDGNMVYGFFRKGSKKRYYGISQATVLQKVLA